MKRELSLQLDRRLWRVALALGTIVSAPADSTKELGRNNLLLLERCIIMNVDVIHIGNIHLLPVYGDNLSEWRLLALGAVRGGGSGGHGRMLR